VLPPPDKPLKVLFCGINPGLVSAATGHHYAGPGNRFWAALHLSGFTPTRLRPDHQSALPPLGLGLTNLVARPTARADELTTAELTAGGRRLRVLLADRAPRWLAVVGVTAYRTAFARRGAAIGAQEDRLDDARVWVLPNPSGLNARWTLPMLADEFARLRAAAGCSTAGCPAAG
jgi:TDG/mug DNA glycosylase family protein